MVIMTWRGCSTCNGKYTIHYLSLFTLNVSFSDFDVSLVIFFLKF